MGLFFNKKPKATAEGNPMSSSELKAMFLESARNHFSYQAGLRAQELRAEGLEGVANLVEGAAVKMAFKGFDPVKADNETLEQFFSPQEDPEMKALAKAELVMIANDVRASYEGNMQVYYAMQDMERGGPQ